MIETQGLQYQYPNAPALAFEDLRLEQGEVLLLRGKSGSGKSTWLALASGLLVPTAGLMRVAGQSLADLKPAARDAWRARTLGFLPQKLYLSEALSVQGNLALAYFAAGLREDTQAMARALAALDVAHLRDRKPSQLSGGQAQRVALARAVLLSPRIILADEPTASLDDDSAHAALALLQQSAARCGATLVIATHDARVEAALPGARVQRLMARAEVSA